MSHQNTTTSGIIRATTLVRASDYKQVAPPRCEVCGSALDHESSVLLVDRLADARAILEVLDVAPLMVSVNEAGLVQILLDPQTFKQVTAAGPNRPALAVTTTDKSGLGARVCEAMDGFFRYYTQQEPVGS